MPVLAVRCSSVQCAHLVVVDPRKCLRRRLRRAQRLLVVVHLGRVVGEVRLDLLRVRVRGVVSVGVKRGGGLWK